MAVNTLPVTIRPTSAPNLPVAPVEYEKQHQDQFAKVIQIYFTQNDNNSSAVLGRLGGQYLTFPYGAFYDTTTQSATSTSAAYPITWNSNYDAGDTLGDGVIVDPLAKSHIKMAFFGTYNIQATLNFQNTGASNGYVYVWFSVGGTVAPQTASKTLVTATSGSVTVSRNYVFHIDTATYVEVYWATSSTSIALTPIVAASPVPAIPSAAVSLTFVSGTHT
jgi:hypothetical protein